MTVRQLIFRTFLVVLIAAIVGAVAYVISHRQPRKYQATAQLLFAPRTDAFSVLGVPAGPQDENAAVADNVLDVGSFDIARRTAGALGRPFTADSVAGMVSVSAQRGSDVVGIQTRAGSPQEAARVDGAYLQQYLRADFQRTSGRARDARRALDVALRSIPKTVRNGARGDALRNQIATLQIFERTGNPPKVIQGVRAGANPVSPQTTRNTLFGVLFGALLAIGLIAARSAISPSPRD